MFFVLNGQYHVKKFVDDNTDSADVKLMYFLNQSEIKSDDIISITHTYYYDRRRDCDSLSILLVYVGVINPYGMNDMGMF